MGQSTSSTLTTLPDLALHCLRVADGSPADGLIEPFFDYLIGVDEAASVPTVQPGAALAVTVPTPAELQRTLEDNEGRRIGLVVYNAKTQRIRGGYAEWEGGGKGEGGGLLG
jgi:hypothetical protein